MIPDHLYPLTQKLSGSKLCIFDFDGTLVNLESLNFYCICKVTMKFVHKKPDLEFYRQSMAGREAREGFRNVLSHLVPDRVDEFDFDTLRTEYHKYKRQALQEPPETFSRVVPGAQDFLQILKKRSYHLAIASASTREFMEKLMKYYKLYDNFEFIIAARDVPESKPSPLPYNTVISHFHLPVDEIIAFEDSKNGIRSAKSAGLYTVGIHNPGWNDSFVWDMADITVSDYRECIDALP